MAGEVRDQAPGLQEMLGKLAVVQEGFVQDTARLELDLVRTSALDPKLLFAISGRHGNT
jgi:hypothetical protein